MKRLGVLLASLSLALALSAPIAMADDGHSGLLPPPSGGGGNIVWPSKGHFVFDVLSFMLNLESAFPLM